MKNVIVCKNCSVENPLHQMNCKSCGAFLREKIANIDLWKTIALLIESPVKAFRNIIQADHKNFLMLLLILTVFKFWISTIYLSLVIHKDYVWHNFFLNYLLLMAVVVNLIIIVAAALKFLLKRTVDTRVKDIFSVITYSFLPYAFAAVILIPIELIVFGEYLFSASPSPFQIKETVAWTLLIFEILIIIWSLVLNIAAFYAMTKMKVFSLVSGVIFNTILFLIFNLFASQ